MNSRNCGLSVGQTRGGRDGDFGSPLELLTPSSEHALVIDAAAGDQYDPLLTLLLTTGLRLGEATGLLWPDVDVASGKIDAQRTLQRQKRERGQGRC